MQLIHARLAIAVAIYLAIAGLWGIALAWRHRPMSPALRGTLVIAEGVMIVQVLIGVLLYLTGARPGSDLHLLYGFLSIIVLPLAAIFAQRRSENAYPLILGLAAVFLAGIAIRAMSTGAHP